MRNPTERFRNTKPPMARLSYLVKSGDITLCCAGYYILTVYVGYLSY